MLPSLVFTCIPALLKQLCSRRSKNKKILLSFYAHILSQVIRLLHPLSISSTHALSWYKHCTLSLFSSQIYPILYVIIYSHSRSGFWFTLSKYLVYLSPSLVKVLIPTQVHLFIQYLVHLPLSTQIPVLLPFLVHLSTHYLVYVPFLFLF